MAKPVGATGTYSSKKRKAFPSGKIFPVTIFIEFCIELLEVENEDKDLRTFGEG